MMSGVSDVDLLLRLLLAALLGATIGFEREISNKSAGLRTNTLIAVGAALFTLMSAPCGRPWPPQGRPLQNEPS